MFHQEMALIMDPERYQNIVLIIQNHKNMYFSLKLFNKDLIMVQKDLTYQDNLKFQDLIMVQKDLTFQDNLKLQGKFFFH